MDHETQWPSLGPWNTMAKPCTSWYALLIPLRTIKKGNGYMDTVISLWLFISRTIAWKTAYPHRNHAECIKKSTSKAIAAGCQYRRLSTSTVCYHTIILPGIRQHWMRAPKKQRVYDHQVHPWGRGFRRNNVCQLRVYMSSIRITGTGVHNMYVCPPLRGDQILTY